MQELLKIWHDDDDYCDDNKDLAEWYIGYKQYKTQKGQIKEELIPTAWHLTRMQDCCMEEMRSKRLRKYLYLGKMKAFMQLGGIR